MRDIQKEIQDNLDAIEKKYNVKILLAVESGSRAWGFASPDSDYDVRFIYVHRPEEYLRIDSLKDVIEWQLDEVLDINGWDLRKALLAFGKGNPNMMEWSNSPIIYRKATEWDVLKEAVLHYFSEKAALCHYYGTANSTLQGFLTGEMIRYKKYFYALRPLLCCRWIERYHAVPPMEFDKLLTMFNGPDDVLTQELYAAIQELLARKSETEEKDLNPQMPVIISFITEECARQKQISAAAPDDHRHDYTELNAVFQSLLCKLQAKTEKRLEDHGIKISLEALQLRFSVCKVTDYSGIDLAQPFCFTGTTDEENSLVCPETLVPENTTERDDGWRGFRIIGQLDFSLIGILARISKILASNGIGIFAISTYNTDYIFTKEDNFAKAMKVLEDSGYDIHYPPRADRTE